MINVIARDGRTKCDLVRLNWNLDEEELEISGFVDGMPEAGNCCLPLADRAPIG